MLKRWRVGFDPSQDYFRHRHLWVLLARLPLYLWNEKSLMAIGNTLGRFISLDSKLLTRPNKKMARLLVELDIHEGLLETLDIEWRGRTTRQKIDYLGIPFRCTLCRQTGHLRKSCTDNIEEEISEDSMLELASFSDSPTAPSQPYLPDYPDDGNTTDLNTLSGKLKNICPTLYASLFSLELDLLDSLPQLPLGQITTSQKACSSHFPSQREPNIRQASSIAPSHTDAQTCRLHTEITSETSLNPQTST
jgi:hypothetical protein